MSREIKIIKVNESISGLKLTKVLNSFEGLSFNSSKYLFRKKEIKLNNKNILNDVLLSNGDEIKIFYIKKDQNNYKKNKKIKKEQVFLPKHLIEAIKRSKIYEDEKIICINKPYGLAVQGGTKVQNCVSDFFQFLSEEKLYQVHRIDKNTRGLLILAKDLKTAQEITLAFKEKAVKKEYIAIVYPIPFRDEGEIDLPILIDEFEKQSKTTYETIKKYQKENISILKLNPETGRKHQIRIHLSEIGSPIIGDRKYNGNKILSKYLQLFATKIEIPNFKKIELNIENILNLENLDNISF